MNAVCQRGLRPDVTGCPEKMKVIIAKCWDATPSARPCLFFVIVFTHQPCFFTTSCPVFQLSKPLSKRYKSFLEPSYSPPSHTSHRHHHHHHNQFNTHTHIVVSSSPLLPLVICFLALFVFFPPFPLLFPSFPIFLFGEKKPKPPNKTSPETDRQPRWHPPVAAQDNPAGALRSRGQTAAPQRMQ